MANKVDFHPSGEKMKNLYAPLLLLAFMLSPANGQAANACDTEIRDACYKKHTGQASNCVLHFRDELSFAIRNIKTGESSLDGQKGVFESALAISLPTNSLHYGYAPIYRCFLAELDKLFKPSAATERAGRQDYAAGDSHTDQAADSKQELSAEARAQEKLHQASFAYYEELGLEVDSAGGQGKKRVVLPQYPKCLKAVDIKEDSTVKNMYWYSIQNTCDKKLRVLWCEGAGCKPTTKAWDIPAGEKERSWMTSRSGVRGVAFHGTACQLSYQGREVYYDKKKAQCWAWDR